MVLARGARAAALALAALVAGCVPAPPAGTGEGRLPITGAPGAAADTFGMYLRPLLAADRDALPGVLAVTAESNRAVVFVNPLSGRAFAYAGVGWAPRAILASADGRTLYVANTEGDRYAYGTISIVSSRELYEVDRIELSPYGGLRGMALGRSGTFLYVASESRRAVLEINLVGRNINRVFDLPRGYPSQLALNETETRLFVTDPGSSTLWAIDLAGGAIGEALVGRSPEGVAISPDGLSVWVANKDDGTISLVDPYTLASQGLLVAGRAPVAIAFTPDGERALVVVAGESAVAVFGATSRARLSSVPVAGYPAAIVVDPSGRRAYVTSTRDDVITSIELTGFQTQVSMPVGRLPMGIAWIPRP